MAEEELTRKRQRRKENFWPDERVLYTLIVVWLHSCINLSKCIEMHA